MKTGNAVLIGAAVVLVAVAGIWGGYALNAPVEQQEGTRGGEWPEVPCPPALENPEQGATVGQRLSEIQALAQSATPPPTPPQLQQIMSLCASLSANEPADPIAGANHVHAAWLAANATPPNWSTVIGELTGGGN